MVAVGVIMTTVWVARAPPAWVGTTSGMGVGMLMPNICRTGFTIPWAIFGVTRKKRKMNSPIRMMGRIVSAEQPMRLGGEYKGYSSGSNGSLGLGVSIILDFRSQLCGQRE